MNRPDHKKDFVEIKKAAARREEDDSLRKDDRFRKAQENAQTEAAPKEPGGENSGSGQGGQSASGGAAGGSAGAVAQISIAAVAAVAAVSLGIVEVPGLTGADARAEIMSLTAYDTVIEYVLDIDNPDDRELSVRLFNDYFSEGITIGGGEFRGTFSGLKPETKYTLEVSGNFGLGKKTIASQNVATTEEAKLERVVFHWSMDTLLFDLELSGGEAFSGFRAVLDDGGTPVRELEIDDPGKTQSMDIAGLLGDYGFTVTAVSAVSGGAEEILYTAIITI